MTVPVEGLVRAPHLAVTWRAGRPTVTDGVTGRVHSGSLALLRLLDLAGEPLQPEELADRAGVGPGFVGDLVAAGLLVRASEEAPASRRWSTFELIAQRMSGGSGRRAGLELDEMPPLAVGAVREDAVAIPAGPSPGMRGLGELLARRRSHREFAAEPLELALLGEFLRGSCRVLRIVPAVGVSFRPYPSAGGRHPLEVRLAALHVDGLGRGVYHFDPYDPRLLPLDVDRRPLDELPERLGRCLDSDLPVEPAVVLLITAVFARTMWRYHDVGLGLIHRDTGALLQTLSLVATALGLAGCPVHLPGELAVARWLGLDPLEESLVGCFLLGLPLGP